MGKVSSIPLYSYIRTERIRSCNIPLLVKAMGIKLELMYIPELGDMEHYHLVDMKTFILLVESQAIMNRITGFKSKNILKCAFKAEMHKAQCAWCVWRACVSKALPQMGNTVPYYLFDYGNMGNINLNILLGCLVVHMS